jgi:hypothetical protein
MPSPQTPPATIAGLTAMCTLPGFRKGAACITGQMKIMVPVAHTCNPSYSGGRDQGDHSSRPASANSSGDPILKKNITKKSAGGVAPVLKKKSCFR